MNYDGGGGLRGELQIGALSADGRTAEQIVISEIDKIANGAQLAYVIPGSMIGYQPGFGAAYNFTSNSSDGQSATDRVIVMASVLGGVAVVLVCAGPLVPFGSGPGQYNDGHPSIADLEIAQFGDPIVDSVMWPGERTP